MKITDLLATVALLTSAVIAAPTEANKPKGKLKESWSDDVFQYQPNKKHQVSLKKYIKFDGDTRCTHNGFDRGYVLNDGKCQTFKKDSNPSVDWVAFKIPEPFRKHQQHCEITFYSEDKCRGEVQSFLTTQDQTFDEDDPTCRKALNAKSALLTCAETWDGLLKKGGSPWLHPDSSLYEGSWQEKYYTSEAGNGRQGVWNRLKCRWNKHRKCNMGKWTKAHGDDEIDKW